MRRPLRAMALLHSTNLGLTYCVNRGHLCIRSANQTRRARSLVTPATAPGQPQSSEPLTHKAAMDSQKQELLQVSRDLLQSIADRDWSKYAALCDDSLTAFEPEAVGHLVEGLPFHEFYFDLLKSRGDAYTPPVNTISQPHVRLLGADAAVVSYVRLQQKIDSSGRPLTVSAEETRVWQRIGGKWKNVHFHRSPTTPSG